MKIKQPPVSHECIDGEVVIINMDSGKYYSLLDMAAALWHCIDAGTTREALLARVQNAYAEQNGAHADVTAFLDALFAEGLIDTATDVRSESPAPPLPATYVAPRLETFTDLQELLMLDPIHEVDATGWPNKS